MAAQYATTWYPNHEAMLTQDGLDAIGIASPDTYHAAHAKACVESGKHVLVEKQIAADRGAAREMCHLVDARRLVLPTAFCIRYAEPYEQAKLLIQTRAIG